MHIMKLITSVIFFISLLPFYDASAQDQRDLYQLKIYHIETDAQEMLIDSYLKQAYVPAMHRAGIPAVGVFKTIPAEEETAKRAIYVLVPYKEADEIFQVEKTLEQDEVYLNEGEDYIHAPHDSPPYRRMETILLKAFEGHPNFQVPNLTSAPEKRIYELRSYESATEEIFKNKVKMFNDGDEIGLFERLGFNAVFYGEVVAGCHMPNLMYMTTFEDKASRDEHWKSFVEDSEWKSLSANPEYQNNVSHINIAFLYPTAYSDF